MTFSLKQHEKMRLECQKHLSWILLPLLGTLCVLALRVFGGYRYMKLRQIRSQVQKIFREAGDRPLILCSNHLTMIDSMLLIVFMFSLTQMIRRPRALAWNVPEFDNFGRNMWLRLFCFCARCVYIQRDGSLRSKQKTFSQMRYLLKSKQLLCIFPEGGRSRTGKLDDTKKIFGVGKLLQEVPDTLVVCCYLRGRSQEGHSFFPKKGEVFELDLALVQPKTDRQGRLGARDLTCQVMTQLSALEAQHFQRKVAANDLSPPCTVLNLEEQSSLN